MSKIDYDFRMLNDSDFELVLTFKDKKLNKRVLADLMTKTIQKVSKERVVAPVISEFQMHKSFNNKVFFVLKPKANKSLGEVSKNFLSRTGKTLKFHSLFFVKGVFVKSVDKDDFKFLAYFEGVYST